MYSIILKGNIRKERIKNLKSHKDYGYTYEMELIPYLDDKELDSLVDFLKTLSFPGKNQKLTKKD